MTKIEKKSKSEVYVPRIGDIELVLGSIKTSSSFSKK
jgi:hypothetical protein